MPTFYIFDRCQKALAQLSKSFSTDMKKLFDGCAKVNT